MGGDRIWSLLARKVAAEASLTELAELDLLLQQHPEAAVLSQLLIPVPADKQPCKETLDAFEKLLQRLPGKDH